MLDQPTKIRAELLIGFRQRIHAGRMLAEFPTGVPGVKPEQGRDAKGTADLVIRSVSEWLDRQMQNPDLAPNG